MENKKKEELQLITNDTFIEIMKHQRQAIENYKKIVFSCLATIVAIIAIMCTGFIYFFANYEVEVVEEVSYEQSSDGESQIINGNSYNDNSIHNDSIKE